MEKKTPESILFEQVDEVNDGILQEVPEDKQKPRIGDPEWTDYVLSLLEDGEAITIKDKKLPKTDALRRISSKILGKLVKSKAHSLQLIPTDKGLIAVVSHELIIDRYGEEGLLEVWGVADVREDCLTFPFNQHVTANASTKAMGRAYRDALQLQVCVAEELNNVGELVVVEDPEDAGPASSEQKSGIKGICRRLNIDVDKFINMGSTKHKNIDKVLKGTARQMMSVLNGYQSGKEIPEDIKI